MLKSKRWEQKRPNLRLSHNRIHNLFVSFVEFWIWFFPSLRFVCTMDYVKVYEMQILIFTFAFAFAFTFASNKSQIIPHFTGSVIYKKYTLTQCHNCNALTISSTYKYFAIDFRFNQIPVLMLKSAPIIRQCTLFSLNVLSEFRTWLWLNPRDSVGKSLLQFHFIETNRQHVMKEYIRTVCLLCGSISRAGVTFSMLCMLIHVLLRLCIYYICSARLMLLGNANAAASKYAIPLQLPNVSTANSIRIFSLSLSVTLSLTLIK